MDDFNSETDSDYTSYWRDWVRATFLLLYFVRRARLIHRKGPHNIMEGRGREREMEGGPPDRCWILRWMTTYALLCTTMSI